MAKRVTINKVNARIGQYGFEIVKGNGYYYYSRLTDESPNLTEEGIYGTPFLNAWTIDQLENMLVERIEKDKPLEREEGYTPFILNTRDHLQERLLKKYIDNK